LFNLQLTVPSIRPTRPRVPALTTSRRYRSGRAPSR